MIKKTQVQMYILSFLTESTESTESTEIKGKTETDCF